MRVGSYLLWNNLGVVHSTVILITLMLALAFFILVIAIYVTANRKLSEGATLDRVHSILLRTVGTILLILFKGTILIPLEMILSPLLCFSSPKDYPGCKTSVIANWYASIAGIVLSLLLITMTAVAATFSTRECFPRNNYLSSATPSVELLDQLTKLAILLCAMFAPNIGRPVAAGVLSTDLDPISSIGIQGYVLQLELKLPEFSGRITKSELDRLHVVYHSSVPGY